jgi:hypothetical protein
LAVNATDIIHEIEALPAGERSRVAAWLTEKQKAERRARLARLAGCWTVEQANAIERLIEESFEQVEHEPSPA